MTTRTDSDGPERKGPHDDGRMSNYKLDLENHHNETN